MRTSSTKTWMIQISEALRLCKDDIEYKIVFDEFVAVPLDFRVPPVASISRLDVILAAPLC